MLLQGISSPEDSFWYRSLTQDKEPYLLHSQLFKLTEEAYIYCEQATKQDLSLVIFEIESSDIVEYSHELSYSFVEQLATLGGWKLLI